MNEQINAADSPKT